MNDRHRRFITVETIFRRHHLRQLACEDNDVSGFYFFGHGTFPFLTRPLFCRKRAVIHSLSALGRAIEYLLLYEAMENVSPCLTAA